MSTETHIHATEEEARQVAEDARETEWAEKSFMKEMFLGNFRFNWIYPMEDKPVNPEFAEFYANMKAFLDEHVDGATIDASGEYPEEVIDGLRKLGAFGIKIPKEYGGLGFSQSEYAQTLELMARYDGSVVALISAHQSIGLPQPLKLFGTPEQKKEFLPRCASGAISAFALTENHVGSDPARLSTTATLTPEGDAYILNGEKLWCTNGTLAEIIVVMASNPETHRISAFIVDTATEGVTVKYRCRFMGLRALGNGVITFDNVRIPKGNLIGKEGRGLKIALVTLNTGRLSLPATCVGSSKLSLNACRQWAQERIQWGVPIGKHEAIAHKLSDMASTIFAMESISELANKLAERQGYDIRLEAAAAKEWNSTRNWRVMDESMQIRGGRGYETELSLRQRGDQDFPVERQMRDARINMIFEGSSEVMHLFMAREAVDKHLSVAGAMIDPKVGIGAKLAALPKIAFFYAFWYPKLWLRGLLSFFGYGKFGRFAKHLRFIDSSCAKLARETFHGMMVYQAKMERKQGFLFRVVDIANELFAMTATIARAERMVKNGHADAKEAAEVAEMFCLNARRNVQRWFKEIWANDDAKKTNFARNFMSDSYTFLEGDKILGEAVHESAASTKAEVEAA